MKFICQRFCTLLALSRHYSYLERVTSFAGFQIIGLEFSFAELEKPVEFAPRVFILIELLETIISFNHLHKR